MAIRKKKKINPKYKVRRATQIRIIIVVILLIVVINNYNFYTGIPVIGNLSNGGIVAELENDIYYIKYSDGVYRSKFLKDKKIIDGQVYSMQIDQKYLYYMRDTDTASYIERIDRYGKGNEELLTTIQTDVKKFYIYDDYIYYVKDGANSGIYRLNVNNLHEENLIQVNCDDFQVDSNKIYYLVQNYLAIMNLDASEKDIILNDNLSNFIIYKEWIYYTNNMNGDFMRVNRIGSERNTLINHKFIGDFNIYDDRIYFYDNVSQYICSISLSGTALKQIVKVNNKDTMINITSNGDIYYLEYYQENGNYEYTRINQEGKSKNISMNWREL